MAAASHEEKEGVTVVFAGKHGTRECTPELSPLRSSTHGEAPELTAKQGQCPPPRPKQVTAQDLLIFLPAGSSAFHSVIYSPSNKFPPLSFTSSALPFCHLIIHLAPWDSLWRNLRVGSNSGAGP